jgi:hypothetical protein
MTDLERRLAALAVDYPFPSTPDLAGAAGRRLAAASRPRRRRRLALVVAFAALALAGALALSPGARGALGDLLGRIPGVRVERVEELPAMPLAEGGAYGAEVSLAQAERLAPFDLRLPAGLGEPDRVYHRRDGAGADVVTVVYGGEREAGLVLTTWPLEHLLVHKLVGPGTDAETVDMGASTAGIWISGRRHVVFYLSRDRRERALEGALAGNVLIWQDGGLGHRLEAGVTRERALQLAAGLE